MIQAERLLLEAALEDPSNQRFVLLSDRLVFPIFLYQYKFHLGVLVLSLFLLLCFICHSYLKEETGLGLAYVCANLVKNLSFYFPCAAVFLCTTFPTCTIMSWFLQGVSWTGRRRLWFLRCLALILFQMFNFNPFKLAFCFIFLKGICFKGGINEYVYIAVFLM